MTDPAEESSSAFIVDRAESPLLLGNYLRKYATFESLEADHPLMPISIDEGTRLKLKGHMGSELFKISIVLIVSSLFMFGLGLWSSHLKTIGEFYLEPSFCYVLGAVGVAFALFLGLIFASVGGDRDSVIELHPQLVKLDHWIGGDHIVRNFGPDDVQYLAVYAAAPGIEVGTKMGGFSILGGNTETCIHVSRLMAFALWGTRARIAKNVRTLAVGAIKFVAIDGAKVENGEERKDAL